MVLTKRSKLPPWKDGSYFVTDASKPDLFFRLSAWDLPAVGASLRNH
jgi:hypothetical protein